ncbi:MAG: TetR/AcrR family transcriptional regulator [bacterium]|nr:TetR/AcrR family transcriptional regulator [bacterium]
MPSADRRKQILREAMQCFANLGFRGTTTRVLAERVGISEAALYRYFPSKESLYEAIIDQKMSVAPDLLDSLRPAVERRDDAAVFGGLARGIFERVDEDSAFLRIMMFTALEGHALAEPFFATRVRRLRDFITEYVAMRIAEGAFRDVHSGLAGRAFLGMVFDHLNVRYIFREGASRDHSLEDAADTFVSIFLGGIRTVVPTGEEPT